MSEANLKTVQSVMGGTVDAPAKETFFSNSATIAEPQAAQSHVVFRLTKKKKGRVHIDGVCDNVLNPKTKRRERIWLLNGVDSIWQSDLLDILKDKEYVSRNRRSLIFENGICRLPVQDERAIEFARATTKNVGKVRNSNGKFDFYEYDANEEQKARFEKQKLRIDMVIKAREMPGEKMRKLSSFLGISFVDDIGMPKSDDGIRTELMIKADNFPEQFSKYIDSEEVDVQYMVKKAIIDAKIDLTGQSGNALWANGKGFICKIPTGRKHFEYLTELAMTNSEEGRKFKEELQTFGK